VLAVHGVAGTLGAEQSAGPGLLVGLPALVGQLLLALLVARRGSRGGGR